MYETSFYLHFIKSSLGKRIGIGFLHGLLTTLSGFFLAFLFLRFTGNCVYFIVSPPDFGSIFLNIRCLSLSAKSLAVVLVLLFIGAFTNLSRVFSAFILLWKGFSFGVASFLLREGSLNGIGDNWKISVWILLLILFGLILFSTFCSIYSEAISFSLIHRAHGYTRSLAEEMFKCFLLFSGVLLPFFCVSLRFL